MGKQHQNLQNLTLEEASRLIDKSIKSLKDKHRIYMGEIGEAINYRYLSKARNIKYHQNKGTERVGGKDLRQVLTDIFKTYNLTYDEVNDDILFDDTGNSQMNGTNIREPVAWYVFNYFTQSVNNLNRGLIIFYPRKVELIVITPNDFNFRIAWTGEYSFREPYLFLHLQMADKPHIKSMFTLYSGITKHWHSYFIGNFCGIRGDGAMIAGKGLLEKVADEEAAMKKIKEEVDPRIVRFVDNSVITTEGKMITSLEMLS
ncbi:MAG: hypothetical protein R8P61_28275 [Bacteroidia bacterium]|nr:hypothetical protein [Bacteroidia bacterium]